ncbi:F-box protein At5g03100-like [Lolium perenne]|uniref:F-box protein At5g03100-like n=1 Tax=Lolium perenne TaxID=4522 RepID=UPI0021F5CC0F|nr:F-box/FBD/LRR-repeat protein At5g22700-like [Lolium perenne]
MSADDARRLFQGTRGPDLSALPDEMLQHILSFLPAQEAVQTCVLARRWRHLWRSTTGLRLVGRDGPGPARDLRKFVGNLLRRHDKRTDLHTVEIKIKFDAYSDGDNLPYVVLWIRSAVRRRVRSLTLHHFGPFLDLDTSQQLGPSLYLDGAHLDSPHLTTLDLASVEVEYTLLDFASCPALEYLKLHECYISLSKIYSTSLKHLSITGCFYDPPCRLHVSAPGLVSLRLDNFWGVTPFFENMGQLETASVNLGRHCQDTCCSYLQYGIYCGADNACLSCEDYTDELAILGGVSSARHLELISEFQNITLSRDLEHRSIFSNLKTLLVNEYWCMPPASCDRLACILKTSPVLQKLTLQLFSKGPNHEVEMKGSYRAMEGPSAAISEHLKIVEVKCNAVDDRILEVLKFLRAFNIRFDVE